MYAFNQGRMRTGFVITCCVYTHKNHVQPSNALSNGSADDTCKKSFSSLLLRQNRRPQNESSDGWET